MGDLKPIEYGLLNGLIEGETMQRLSRRYGMTRPAAVMTLYRLRQRVGAATTAQLIAVAFRKGWLS